MKFTCKLHKNCQQINFYWQEKFIFFQLSTWRGAVQIARRQLLFIVEVFWESSFSLFSLELPFPRKKVFLILDMVVLKTVKVHSSMFQRSNKEFHSYYSVIHLYKSQTDWLLFRNFHLHIAWNVRFVNVLSALLRFDWNILCEPHMTKVTCFRPL